MNHKVILSGIHLELTEALKSFVWEKTDRLFKHEDAIIRARIELECSSRSEAHATEFVAKGHLELKGATITISSSSDDLYNSIDDLVSKLDRGLRRRSRMRKVRRRKNPLIEDCFAA